MAKGVWETLLKTVAGWLDDEKTPGPDSNEDEADPSLMFHLLVIAPLLLAVIALSRRAL